MTLQQIGEKAKNASKKIALTSSEDKNRALLAIAGEIAANADKIIESNKRDTDNAKANGISASLLDRLTLDTKRINDIAEAVKKVSDLDDPIGKLVRGGVNNGLDIRAIRVPLGVIAMIYEARPNVTVDAAVLAFKAGNAVILRGGKEAIESNITLTEIMRKALEKCGLDKDIIQIMKDTSRESVAELMKLREYVDVLIPRGGAGLIKSAVENSTVPVIETGTGNCHVYIDDGADINMGAEIIFNAKCDRPSVCNAAETLLVHKNAAKEFLPAAYEKLKQKNVEIRGCVRTQELIKDAMPASEDDYYKEFGDYILAVKIVENIDSAIEHINKYSTKHSEAIVTKDYANSRKFINEVDAAAVYVNASTRFTDGGVFGLGAEIGISTQKLHSRGPMGLEAMTTVKYQILGDGNIR